jgi:ComF family protein
VCGKPAIYGLTHPRCLKKYEIDGVFAAVSYNGVAKKLIYSFKYKPYLSDLKTFLSDLMYEAIIQKEEFMALTKNDLIFVPVPVHSSKLRSRGYNQAEILAKELSKKFEFSVQNLLVRAIDTKSQFKLSKEERKENVKGVFLVWNAVDKDKTYFLIDDVVTTGATFREAAKILKKSGAKKVFGLAFAQD